MEPFIGKNVSSKHLKKVKQDFLYDDEKIQAMAYGRVKEESSKSKGRHDLFS